jgi:hypothetical protein
MDERDMRVAELAYQELLAQAAQERLARQSRPPRGLRHAIASVGRILMRVGRLLTMIAEGSRHTKQKRMTTHSNL